MLYQRLSNVLHFNGEDKNIDFYVSSLTEYNPFYSTEDIKQWLLSINDDQYLHVTQIPIKHHKRVFGKGNYNFIRSLIIWINLTTGFSIVPLRIVSYFGLIIAIFSLIFGGYLIFWKLFFGNSPEGWASTVFVVLFIGGIQLLALGLIGEYLGRTYLNINNQPQFIIKDKINLK